MWQEVKGLRLVIPDKELNLLEVKERTAFYQEGVFREMG